MIKKTYVRRDNEEFQLETEEEYDERNNIICCKRYLEDKEILREVSQYNDRNDLVKKTEYSVTTEDDNQLNENFKEVYQYDNDHLLIETKRTTEGKLLDKVVVTRKDKQELHDHFDIESKLYYRKEILTDSVKRELVEIEYDFDANQEVSDTTKTVQVKDENGNTTNLKMYEDETLVVNEDYWFDKNNNEIRSLGMTLDIKEKVEIFKEWNAENKLIEVKEYTDDKLTIRKNYTYDENNLMIEELVWYLVSENLREETVTRRFEYRAAL